MKKSKKRASRVLTIIIIILLAVSAFLMYRYLENNKQQWANANIALNQVESILKKDIDFRKEQPTIGTVIGKMKIENHTDWMPILEGEDLDIVMMHGIGHIETTPMPGDDGNSVVSAHRETFFRPLENVSNGDIVVVEMPYGTFKYEIMDQIIVKPNEGSKVYGYEFESGQGLTLLTCYPFNAFSPPNERIAFFAQLIE